ncbi:hypothetical protein THASP1DRAFT_28810, partial [Thamnocephalis sphaerospora]
MSEELAVKPEGVDAGLSPTAMDVESEVKPESVESKLPATTTSKKSTDKPKSAGHIYKRAPIRQPIQPNEIFVRSNCHFRPLMGRAKSLLSSDEAGFDFIVLHGVGAAIGSTINLAISIQYMMHDQVTLETTTSTTTFIDDTIPDDPDAEIETNQRTCSSIQVIIRRKPALESATTQPIRKGWLVAAVAAHGEGGHMRFITEFTPLEAAHARLTTSAIDVNVSFYTGGNQPYTRVYVSSTRFNTDDQWIYLLKIHEYQLEGNVVLGANSDNDTHCSTIGGVLDPGNRYPGQTKIVLPPDGAWSVNSAAESWDDLEAWNDQDDDGTPFNSDDLVPDSEDIVNNWLTSRNRWQNREDPHRSSIYRCRPGRFGTCMFGDLSAVLGIPLLPHGNSSLPTATVQTVSLHPRLSVLRGRRPVVNFSLALHRRNLRYATFACANIAALDVNKVQEPDSTTLPITDTRWYMESERRRFVGRMAGRAMLSILFYAATVNVIYATILLRRDRRNPARWLLFILTSGVIFTHLPLLPRLLVGDGDGNDQAVPCSLIRALGLFTGYLCTGASLGILMLKAYYIHKRARWVMA